MKDYTLHGNRKLLYGFGINDADYVIRTRENGKCVICPYYQRWISVVQRSNDAKEKLRKPTYVECYTSLDWKYFSDFRTWLDKQPYWQQLRIDKDILFPGNKEYGPDTCVLVPEYLNKCIAITNKGKYMRGVSFKAGKYEARIDIDNKANKLGRYLTEIEAHNAWQNAKADYIDRFITQYATEPWFRTDVADAMLSRVWKLRLDALNGVETNSL